jgi:TRAP-type mannitol/chloroaromatic compound transport system permease small subunit
MKDKNFADRINIKLGEYSAYLVLLMVFTTFSIVVLRYGFGVGKVWLQELVVYFHATFFILGSAYTLLKDKHVRVDVFYSNFSKKKKALVNLSGHLLFTIPVCLFILVKSLPYVQSSIEVLESSPDSGGLPARFLLKSLIPLFCILVIAQALSLAFKSLKILRDQDV